MIALDVVYDVAYWLGIGLLGFAGGWSMGERFSVPVIAIVAGGLLLGFSLAFQAAELVDARFDALEQRSECAP